jgi:hypothetical protein
LEEIKKAGETLMEARGSALVVATKTLVTTAQSFTVVVNQAINEKTPDANKIKVEEYTNKIKASLKTIIPAAKAVGVLNNNAENTPDLKLLKKEVQNLVDSCEIMLINLRMDGLIPLSEEYFGEKKKERKKKTFFKCIFPFHRG